MSDQALEFIASTFQGADVNGEEDKVEREGGVFYFETDYLPLKTNLDYLNLLRTLAILDVQRMKICQDIDKLVALKSKVRQDPEAVKQEILAGEGPFLSRLTIEKVPEIDWSKYKMLDFDGKLTLTTRRMAKQDFRLQQQHHQQHRPSDNDVQQSLHDGKIRVRGRLYTDNKPETFNQLWTVEEQLRLEALLVEYPPEPIESRRWKKIADALGNRTTKQVCSRVQKYFKKLQKAGIAIPGRPMKPWKCNKPNRINKRHKHLLFKPTTFFPGVAMKELGGGNCDSDSEDDLEYRRSSGADSAASPNGNDLSHWVNILTQIKQEKEDYVDADDQDNIVRHYGFTCGSCEEEPIVGTRWECSTCLGDASSSSSSASSSVANVSMCADCLAQMVDSPNPIHPLSHVFVPYHTFSNPQYKAENLGTSNYLDPNFVG